MFSSVSLISRCHGIPASLSFPPSARPYLCTNPAVACRSRPLDREAPVDQIFLVRYQCVSALGSGVTSLRKRHKKVTLFASPQHSWCTPEFPWWVSACAPDRRIHSLRALPFPRPSATATGTPPLTFSSPSTFMYIRIRK